VLDLKISNPYPCDAGHTCRHSGGLMRKAHQILAYLLAAEVAIQAMAIA
jgi:cytochrome b